MITVQKTVVGAMLAAALAAGIYDVCLAFRLSAENRKLIGDQAQLVAERDDALNRLRHATNTAPRLATPRTQPAAVPVADLLSTNRLLAFLKGEMPKLTREQIESCLKRNHRNAASLLAIGRITGDMAYLKEAMENFPNDPRVAFDAVRLSESPEQRRQWLEKFKKNAPDNALATYLSALDHLKAGRSDQAIQELIAAAARPRFTDYAWDYAQDGVEAWRDAGYPDADARMLGTWQLPLPHLAQLKQLHQQLMDLLGSYRQIGDEASAQMALQFSLQLGQRLTESVTDPLIGQMVGLLIQRNTLAAFAPDSAYGPTGQTVAGRLEEIAQQRHAMDAVFDQMETLRFGMSPQDWIAYTERTTTFGELNAFQWLTDKYAPTPLGSFWDGRALVPVESIANSLSAWLAANNGQPPTEASQLLPFATTPEERYEISQLAENVPAMSDDERAALVKRATEFVAECQSGAK